MLDKDVEHALKPNIDVILWVVALIERRDGRFHMMLEPLRRKFDLGEPICSQTIGVDRCEPSTKFGRRPGNKLNAAASLRGEPSRFPR